MATVAKYSTGTDLTLASSWGTGSGPVPATTDIANWVSTSLGTGLTGNLNVGGALGALKFDNALTNIALAGTVTIGTGGLSIAAAGKDVQLAAVAMVGAQTWSIGTGRTLALTGAVTQASAVSVNWLGGGLVTLASSMSFTNSANAFFQNATFRVLSGGSTSFAGTSSFLGIGGGQTATTDIAVVDIQSGTNTVAKTTASAIEIGQGVGYGAMRITGGSVSPSAELDVGTSNPATAHSAGLYMTGGTLTIPGGFGICLNRNYQASSAVETRSMATLTGGTASMGYLSIGSIGYTSAAGLAHFYIGGTHALTLSSTGAALAAGDYCSGIVTVDTNASVTLSNAAGYVIVRSHTAASSSTTYGIFNLKGNLSSYAIGRGTVQATPGTAYLNLDGGTWTPTATALGSYLDGFGASASDLVTVWSGGFNIKLINRAAVYYEINSAIKKPTGSGVDTITFTNGGQGYVAPPQVDISGGGGAGASAAALIDANGTITSIVITSRGQGYTSAPTITLKGQTVSAAGFPSFVAATDLASTISTNPTKAGTITIKSNNGSGGGRMWFGGGIASIYPTAAGNTFNGDIVMEGDSGEFGTLTAAYSNSATNNTYNLTNVTSVSVASRSSTVNDSQFLMAFGGGLATSSETNPHTFTGTGGVALWYNSSLGANPVVFTAGQLAGLTGTAAPSAGITGTGGAWRTRVGSGLWLVNNATVQTGLDYKYSAATIADLPSQLGFYQTSVPASPTLKFTYNGVAADYSSTILGTWTEANSPASVTFASTPSSLSIGDIKRYDVKTGTQSVLFSLSGSNTVSVLRFNGNVSPTSQGSASADSTSLFVRAAATGVSTTAVAAQGSSLTPQHASALNGFAGIYANLNGTLDVSNDLALSNATGTLYLTGAGASSGTFGAIRSQSGVNSITVANITLSANATVRVDSGATLTLTSSGAIYDGGTGYSFTKTQPGTMVNATSVASATYLGPTSFAGTFSISQIANGGTNSHLGKSSNAATNLIFGITTAGTLKYTGAAASTDRNFRIDVSGATIDASGTGALTWLGSPSFLTNNTAYNFTLAGTSTYQNVFSGVLADNGTGKTSFTKNDSGKWVLRPLSGSTPVNNTHSGDNTFGNGTTVLATEAAVATAGQGRVLGTGATTVQNGATIQTVTGTAQLGRMRYGGNLTFQAGSTLIIGG